MKFEIMDSGSNPIGAATSSEGAAAFYVKTSNEGLPAEDCYHYRRSNERLSSAETYNFGLLEMGLSVGPHQDPEG